MNAQDIFPQIETQRLRLRPWRDRDLEPWAAMNADPRVREHFPDLLTREESDAAVNFFIDRFRTHGFCFWAIEEKASGAFAGLAGLNLCDFESAFTPCVEVGWRLAAPFWGQGLATEAALASLGYGFDTLRLTEIVAFTTYQNLRSRRVMDRIGMRHDARETFIHPKMPPDHALQPCVLYRLTAEAHRAAMTKSQEETRS